jgi:hypothetical protein
MTISDALPVQFWLSDCETYNEYEAEGMHHVCWCQPWNCDDEIVLQFQHTTAQDLILIGKGSDGEFLFENAISEIQSGVYQTSLIPEDEDVCDEQLQLLIANDSSILRLLAPSTWTDGASAFDTKNSTQFIESLTSADNNVNALMPLVVPSGTIITFSYTVDVSGTWVSGGSIPIFVTFRLADASEATVSTGVLTVAEKTISANGTYTFTETLTATATTTYLAVSVVENLSSGTASITLTVPTGQVLYVPEASTLAKSDCLDIKTAHTETVLFQYSNQRNFAGLIYENDSPDTSFNIRIPARFVHEIEPEEDEAMELTSSIVTTSSQVKTQRLLEVKHAPYYFHKKLRRVLKHQTLTSQNISWKKEEQYQVNEGRKNWPLKSATCYLTEKNSPVRNVL